MGNVELAGRAKVSPFRKLALGTWQTEYDPSIYGTMRVRADKVLEYIERFRAHTGKHLTITHIVAKAVAIALERCPDANAIIRGNKIYLRKNVDVSVLVLMESNGRKDLSSAKILEANRKSLVDMVEALERRVAKIRKREDEELEKTRQSMGLVPYWFINRFLKILSWLLYGLNINLSWAGLPRDAFGGAIVTSIGSLGLQTAYVPLVPYTRVPIFVAPGAITRVPVVEGNEIVIGNILDINVTMDHRIVDGAHAAELAAAVRGVFDDPFGQLDPLP